jgi:hypothetical protein
MGLLLTFVGVLLLVLALLGVLLGLFMATDRYSRAPGLYFALWWAPLAAASFGVFLRDPVTFVVGLFCFAVAGLALVLERRFAGGSGEDVQEHGYRFKKKRQKPSLLSREPSGRGKRQLSERARAREERAKGYRKEAS